MADPISNAKNLRETGSSHVRPQSSPVPPVPGAVNPQTNLAPDQRIAALEAAMEKLVKKNLPSNSRLQITHDKNTGAFVYRSVDPETGEMIRQWPSEEILKLKESVRELEGMLLDTHV
jgi:uncharacterized FlaG/YvyC family protein